MNSKRNDLVQTGLGFDYIFPWKKEIISSEPMHYSQCADVFNRKLYALNLGLTKRELSVCALALVGMTIDGSALELNIARSSVITYRKRAYARLRISSLNELFGILTFTGRPN